VRVEQLTEAEVTAILQEMDRRRTHYLSDVERLIKSAETMGLGPHDIVKLIERAKKVEDE